MLPSPTTQTLFLVLFLVAVTVVLNIELWRDVPYLIILIYCYTLNR